VEERIIIAASYVFPREILCSLSGQALEVNFDHSSGQYEVKIEGEFLEIITTELPLRDFGYVETKQGSLLVKLQPENTNGLDFVTFCRKGKEVGQAAEIIEVSW